MTTPHKISQWLLGTAPEPFEAPALRAVVEKYPYFWPAGLLRLNSDDDELDFDTASSLRAIYVPAPLRVMAELASLSFENSRLTNAASADDAYERTFPRTISDSPELEATPLPALDASAAHSLEHDPLEDAVATIVSAEEGGVSHNTVMADEPTGPQIGEGNMRTTEMEPLPEPLYASDYFSHQGVAVDATLPDPAVQHESNTEGEADADRGLMVMRSFADWMTFFQRSAQDAQSEAESKRAVRAMWQKEKLAAALEEEEEEIPEEVFQMAVASIAPDGVVSESLAEVLAAQGKWERAIDMYRKLTTKEPSKSAYFARKIEALEARHADS
jgi:hypothetical protein